ncbi:protein PFF0380w isoform X2 [Colletes gigas]|nr:protein PFF0380w isoform X2 [Colletes gigas]
MDEELQNSNVSCNKLLLTEDDSILDFKSPKSKIIKPTLSECTKFNILKQKRKTTTKLKNVGKNHKEIKLKQHSEKRKQLQESQLSIESSFFKSKIDCDNKDSTTDVKVAFVCPLCFKTFKDINSQVLHMKICACKNNISTKKLLDAIELQKRQEDERISLGLLAAPKIQDKKRPVSCRINSYQDSDLQLALVLSKSLQEAEEFDEISEKLSQAPNQFALKVLEPVNNKPLERFGFANSKPVSLMKTKKKNCNRITVLQTRSQEDRNRILTDRIAEILMGDEPITQKQKQENEFSQEIRVKTVLKSYLLQELYNKGEKIWDKARLTPNQKSFYVSNLSKYIIPQEKQIEAKETVVIKRANTCKMDNIKLNLNKIDTSRDRNKFFDISQTDLNLTSKNHENCEDKQFISTLAINWGDALNDSSASDIIIFVNSGKYIWAHKLVFYVRCSNILFDSMPNDTSQFTAIKEKICWLDTSYNIAIAFLEFIYCGIIQKYLNIFEDLVNFSFLRNLARKYKVKELFAYLQIKESEIKQAEVQMNNMKNIECEETLIVRETDNIKLNSNNLEDLIDDEKDLVLDEKSSQKYLEEYLPYFSTQKIKENTCRERLPQEELDCLNKINIIRQCNASPDMFDDNNYTMPNYKKKCSDQIVYKETKTNEDLSILESIDKINDTANCSKITNTVPYKNVEECINSSSNTPHLSRSKQRNINHSNVIKTKSNLSLFIDRFQIENANSDFDTDSEVTTISDSLKLSRNPFNTNQYDDSDLDSISNGNAFAEKRLEEKRDILSKFDYDDASCKLDIDTTSTESDANMHLNFEPIDNLTQLLEHNVASCTEKYMESNSINKSVSSREKKIQNEITASMSENLPKQNANVKSLDNIVTGKACFLSEYNEVQSINSSDFDTDDGEVSIYTRYKKKHQNNSIVNYRDYVAKHVLNNSEECEYKGTSNMDNEDVTVLSDVDIDNNFSIITENQYINKAEKKQLAFDIEESVQTSQHNLQNRNDKIDFSINITSPISTQRNIQKIRKTNNLSELKCSNSESNIDLDAIRNNLLISSTKSRTDRCESVGSPIFISSSPELDFDAVNVDVCNENKVNLNVPNFNKSDDNIEFFEKDIYLANVYNNDDDDNNRNNKNDSRDTCLPIVNRIGLLTESPSLIRKKRKGEISFTTTTNENNKSFRTNEYFLKKFKNSERSLTMKQSNRKFQRKSMSENNLPIDAKNTKSNVSNPYDSLNQSQCKCARKGILKTVTSPTIIRDNVTPSPNYNGMKTPELHRELQKYGLKLQKRNKAVKLLTYIYDELHPKIFTTPKKIESESEFEVISSDDEEPPRKKTSYDKSDVGCVDDYKYELKLSQDSPETIESSVNIISDERKFNKFELTTTTDNPSNINNMFSKLIKVKRELHNNILAYEPLCIESLYSMLKEEGLKCNMNILMNFLDEQCITFYFQDTKLKKSRKK